MKTTSTKAKFLEALTELPFVSYASKRVGISRATTYRWMKIDPKFKKKVETAQQEGHTILSEIAEYVLMKKIKKDEDLNAVKYYLSRIVPRYYPKRPYDVQEQERKEEFDDMMLRSWAESASEVLANIRANRE